MIPTRKTVHKLPCDTGPVRDPVLKIEPSPRLGFFMGGVGPHGAESLRPGLNHRP